MTYSLHYRDHFTLILAYAILNKNVPMRLNYFQKLILLKTDITNTDFF